MVSAASGVAWKANGSSRSVVRGHPRERRNARGGDAGWPAFSHRPPLEPIRPGGLRISLWGEARTRPSPSRVSLMARVFPVVGLTALLVACPGRETSIPPPVPSAPTGVSAAAGNEQVTISWNPSPLATSYNIYWSTSQGVTPTTPAGRPHASSRELTKRPVNRTTDFTTR